MFMSTSNRVDEHSSSKFFQHLDLIFLLKEIFLQFFARMHFFNEQSRFQKLLQKVQKEMKKLAKGQQLKFFKRLSSSG